MSKAFAVRILLIAALFPSWMVAGELRFESGDKQVALLELYTSQGCSSCPPAESWLNGFENDPRLWKEVAPVAFHVDYWDRLGWKDPFASAENTARQYAYRKEGRISSVYTPGFVLNGVEWRGWFDRSKLPRQERNAGNLSIRIEDGRIDARYSEFNDDLELHVSILGIGLETKVTRGENRNRSLRQSFVSVFYDSYEPNGDGWSISALRLRKIAADRLAIAVWLTPKGGLSPIQATGAWLPEDWQR